MKTLISTVLFALTALAPAAMAQGHAGFLESNWIEAPAGTPAPDMNMIDVNGETISLADFQDGRTVVVNFWATWCGPCREEMPTLNALALEEFDSGEHVVLAVALERNPQAAQRFLDNLNANDLVLALDSNDGGFRGLASQGEELAQLSGLPATFIVRADGTLMGVLAGPADWNDDFAQDLVRQSFERES